MMRSLVGWSLIVAGCLGIGPAQASEPTYHKDVLPILQEHCQECHRPGQVAPFTLMTYEQARKRSSDLAAVTGTRIMPPWHASTTVGGPFKDCRVLTAAEIETLARWNEAGAPEGDAKDTPPPKEFASDWSLGEPDLVLTMPEPFTLAAEGRDEFRVFVIPSGLTEGKWIQAIDFRPGNPKIVHHLLCAFDTQERARKFDAKDPGPGYQAFGGFGPGGIPFVPSGSLGGWAPGKAARPTPDGVGRYLPAGSDVLLQVHYHRDGKPETDATKIGIYFAKGVVDKRVRGGMIVPPRTGRFSFLPDLHIPAGDSNYEIKGETTLRDDVHLNAVIPHMHWLGKDFRLTAVLPDGSRKILLQVDRWDFNWQDTYEFADSIPLPAGTKVEMLAHFDNSDANPQNPSHPPKPVSWGEQTTNEMCIGFLQMTNDREHLHGKPPGAARPAANLSK